MAFPKGMNYRQAHYALQELKAEVAKERDKFPSGDLRMAEMKRRWAKQCGTEYVVPQPRPAPNVPTVESGEREAEEDKPVRHRGSRTGVARAQ